MALLINVEEREYADILMFELVGVFVGATCFCGYTICVCCAKRVVCYCAIFVPMRAWAGVAD